MPVTSAGLLLFRSVPELEVFVAHMGGPYWARKQEAAWTIPKGEIDPDEDPLAAACREFGEEIGVAPPDVAYLDLGQVRYASGKLVRVFAGEAPAFDVAEVHSNLFELEWPPRSGRRRSFPEVDAARWATIAEARELLTKGQRPALDALEQRVAGHPEH